MGSDNSRKVYKLVTATSVALQSRRAASSESEITGSPPSRLRGIMISKTTVLAALGVAKHLAAVSLCLTALLLLGPLSAQKPVEESKEIQHYNELAMQGHVEI